MLHQVLRILLDMMLGFVIAIFLEMIITAPKLKKELKEAEEKLNGND